MRRLHGALKDPMVQWKDALRYEWWRAGAGSAPKFSLGSAARQVAYRFFGAQDPVYDVVASVHRLTRARVAL